MDRPLAEEEARRHAEAAETARMMAVLDHTFFSLAHELGNPINSIKMTLDVLLSNFAAYPEATRLEYLQGIHAEFRRLEELLNAIRSFNQFEHLAIETTDVPPLVRNLLQMLRKEIDDKGILLNVTCPTGPILASCDPRALHLSLLQVIDNALDALSGRSDPVLAVAVEGREAACLIRVGDNGAGIPEAKREEVFLPFSSGKPRGVGLGLTMAKKLLTRMNGTIELGPHLPQGTEALITLPLALSHGG